MREEKKDKPLYEVLFEELLEQFRRLEKNTCQVRNQLFAVIRRHIEEKEILQATVAKHLRGIKGLKDYIKTIGDFAYQQHRDDSGNPHADLYKIATMCRVESIKQALAQKEPQETLTKCPKCNMYGCQCKVVTSDDMTKQVNKSFEEYNKGG